MRVELLAITDNPEKLIEETGRTSYLSMGKKGRNTEKSFIRMLLNKGHLSVFEHVTATFRISGVSRAFTHQLVRHRLCSYTQQSQRNVDESNFTVIEPESIGRNHEAHTVFINLMNESKHAYSDLKKMGIKNEDARFVLPNAVESIIAVSANLREWRHIIEVRGSADAQWEIREVIIEILRILTKYAPTVFEDFTIDEAKKLVVKKTK